MKKTIRVEAAAADRYQTTAEIRGHTLTIDQPEAVGGEETGPTPLETLLFSLAGCYTAIGRTLARQRRLEVRGLRVRVEGDIDPDGYLGKRPEAPVGFSEIRLEVEVDAEMSEEEKREFIETIEARCPVSQNLTGTTLIRLALAGEPV